MQVGLGRRPRRLRDHLALPCLSPLRRSPSIQSAALGLSGVRRRGCKCTARLTSIFFCVMSLDVRSWFPLRVPCQAGLSGRSSFIDKTQCAANGARAVGALYPPKNSVPAHHHNLFGAAWNSLSTFSAFVPGPLPLGCRDLSEAQRISAPDGWAGCGSRSTDWSTVHTTSTALFLALSNVTPRGERALTLIGLSSPTEVPNTSQQHPDLAQQRQRQCQQNPHPSPASAG